MSRKRTVVVVVLGILLITTLAVGNVVFAAHATVLDPDTAKTIVLEEDGVDAVTSEFQDVIASEVGLDGDGADGEAGSLLALAGDEVRPEDVVTEEYAREEVGENVDRVYAYLHGNADRMDLSLDAEPIAANLSSATAASVANASTAELFATMGDGAFGDTPVEESTLEQLDGGAESYRAAQAEVRSDVRAEVLDEAVAQAFEERSNDELLALVIPEYDPDDYSEEQKARMVQEREDEIEQALRATIEQEREAEIESTVDDRLATMADDAKDNEVTTGVPAADGPASELRATVIDALVGGIDHATYQERSESARADLGAAVGEAVERDFERQIGDTVDLNEALAIDEQADFGGALPIVAWFDRLAIVLPVLGATLVGLVYYATRSVGRTAGTVGWSLVWVGVPAFVGATLLGDRLSSTFGAGGEPTAVQSMLAGIIPHTVGYFAAQSLAIGVLGLVLVGVALALRYEVVDRFGGGDGEGMPAPAETDADADPLADRGAGGSETGGRESSHSDSTASGASQQDDR